MYDNNTTINTVLPHYVQSNILTPESGIYGMEDNYIFRIP